MYPTEEVRLQGMKVCADKFLLLDCVIPEQFQRVFYFTCAQCEGMQLLSEEYGMKL
jgi:hypothetical protein